MLAALVFNWYPARVFEGDVGTLSIGAIIAAAVILGNFETAGVIILIPYVMDFVMKALHRFPSKGWCGEYNDKLIHPHTIHVYYTYMVVMQKKLTISIAEKVYEGLYKGWVNAG